MYPNPTSNNFSIDREVTKVTIFSLTGQLVKTFEGVANRNYSVSDLTNGIYLVKITATDNSESTMKLVNNKKNWLSYKKTSQF